MQSIHSSYVPYSECRVGLCTELLFTLFLFKLSDWVEPVKKEFLKKLTYANLKRNLQEQIRYTLRNKNQEDLCEELVLILIDILNEELRDKVGPEDILNASQLEELQYALSEGARRIVKTNRIENGAQRLERRVKRAIEKTLVAPQVEKLSEVMLSGCSNAAVLNSSPRAPPLCTFRMLLLSLQTFVLFERKCPAKWTSHDIPP